jgi:hypothetical protein
MTYAALPSGRVNQCAKRVGRVTVAGGIVVGVNWLHVVGTFEVGRCGVGNQVD